MDRGALPGWAAPQPWQHAAPASPGTAALASVKRPGPPLWAAVVVIVLGLVCMVVSFVLAIWPAIDMLLNAEPVFTPSTHVVHLDSGKHGVYERNSRVQVFGPSITPEDVVVTDGSGARIPTHRHLGYTEELEVDGDSYTAIVDFDLPEGGTYTIEITSTQSSEVVIAPLLENSFALGWLVGTATGGVVFVVGAAMLIVGMLRRRRATRP